MPNPHFLPATLLTDSNALTVSKVLVAGHGPTLTEPGGSTYVNHWVIYLQVHQGGSVRLDMSPHHLPGEDATLIIKRLDYNVSNDIVYQLEIPVISGLYVRHVLDRITSKGHHKYRYGEKILECRCWVYTVMCSLEEASWVSGITRKVYDAVSNSWTTGGAKLPQTPAWTQGTFY
jgi:hypothetical protein